MIGIMKNRFESFSAAGVAVVPRGPDQFGRDQQYGACGTRYADLT